MKPSHHPAASACLALLAVIPSPLCAAVKLPAIFSDHMVLEKSEHVPVWGKADPGEKVVVTCCDFPCSVSLIA